MTKWRVLLADEEATVKAGATLAQVLMHDIASAGITLYLDGQLGAGKTTFSRGLLHALGHKGPVKSPTYTLVEPYEQLALPVYHFDLYRLGSEDELLELGFDDYFYGDGVALVEWPERCSELATSALIVDLTYVNDEVRELSVTVSGASDKYRAVLNSLRDNWPIA